jgi:hypothetical protein
MLRYRQGRATAGAKQKCRFHAARQAGIKPRTRKTKQSGDEMADFDYKQRPATPEYHAGWEIAFGEGESKPAPAPTPCTHDLVTFRFGKPYCIACGVPTSIGTKAEAPAFGRGDVR